MSPTEKREALNEEIAYYRRCIKGRNASQQSARRIVRALDADPVMHDQVPFDLLRMIHREARGLPPVPVVV